MDKIIYVLKVIAIWSPLITIPISFFISRRLVWFSGFKGYEMLNLYSKVSKHELSYTYDIINLIGSTVTTIYMYKLLGNSVYMYVIIILYTLQAFYLAGKISAKALIKEVNLIKNAPLTKVQRWYFKMPRH